MPLDLGAEPTPAETASGRSRGPGSAPSSPELRPRAPTRPPAAGRSRALTTAATGHGTAVGPVSRLFLVEHGPHPSQAPAGHPSPLCLRRPGFGPSGPAGCSGPGVRSRWAYCSGSAWARPAFPSLSHSVPCPRAPQAGRLRRRFLSTDRAAFLPRETARPSRLNSGPGNTSACQRPSGGDGHGGKDRPAHLPCVGLPDTQAAARG